jgi:FMN-dependent oxidoreductase (nitrilotriacetate monooxygenase family)
MTARREQMHLGVFWLGTGNHAAGWRVEGATASNCNLKIAQMGVRIAERGKFDLFFVSDSVAPDLRDHPSYTTRLEPTTLIAALSTSTTHIGLGATVSTSFSEPYTVARTFAALQHMSGGRVAWNVVTSSSEKAALNYSREKHTEHDLRYEIANEFVDVVRGLWDTWEEGAVVADRASGVYVDPTKVHTLDHKGRFFQVRGPLNVERSPYGHPHIIQAGGSVPGQELSARTAHIVFSVTDGDPDAAKTAYDGLKARVVKHGRAPDDVRLLPGVMPIVGRTETEAKAQLDMLQGWLSETNALALVSNRVGHDISKYPLDGPIPDLPVATNKSATFSRTLLTRARREGMSLRDLYNVTAAARGHWVVYGTPQRIADILEDWFRSCRADGFIVMPAYFPGAFDDFVDLVVPELQRRGIFRKEYSGATLRDHLA